MTIKHLVLSGGGPKLISQLGVLDKLISEDFINIDNIETIFATSAGFIMAIFLAIRIDFKDLKNYSINKPWDKFIEKNLNILDLNKEKGLLNHSFIIDMIETFLKFKEIRTDITLKELYNLTSINIYFYTTRLNDFSLVEISHKNEPDMPLISAVKASCSIPPIFGPEKYKENYYFDGGLFNNYPLDSCFKVTNCSEEEVLGLAISYPEITVENLDDSNIIEYLGLIISNLVTTVSTDKKQRKIKNEILIPANSSNTSECWKSFISSKSNREERYDIGFKNATDFLERRIQE